MRCSIRQPRSYSAASRVLGTPVSCSAFGAQFVKTGELGREVQAALGRAFDDRLEGDYGDVFPSYEDVERRLEEASSFVDSVVDLLRREGVSIDSE